jgi:outer membrane protein assembly factor BamA
VDGSFSFSFRRTLVGLVVLILHPSPASAQPATLPARTPLASADLRGRTVEEIKILGNTQVSTAVILNVVRTRVGDPFDPVTAEEDLQRIYSLRKFANVKAYGERTATGVIVVFEVTEQKQLREVAFKGNRKIDTDTLRDTIDVYEGEAIDAFRISIARTAIESLYRSRNFPYAHVGVDSDLLSQQGRLVFNIVEGPNVRVRKVDFVGNESFSDDRLKDQVSTKYWIWIFRPGTLDPDALDDDVAALRRYYQQKGFFDARVGRKVTESPDQTEVKVTFLIEEGPRYRVGHVTFRGNTSVSETALRKAIKLTTGEFFEGDLVRRDIREIVRAYSPFGFIYQPGSNNPEYLRIGSPQAPFGISTVFQPETARVDLVYDIAEGRPFKLGRVLVKGNTRTQDKVILREMRVRPGEKYDSAEINDAIDRLRGTPYFAGVSVTPIGEDPNIRDLLVEVTEARTASFGVGAGVNSNGGVGGNITYEQRNFDLTNWPESFGDIVTDRAFVGAGQNLRISVEPGTEASNASIRFTEPWIFDLPYSFTGEAYWRDRIREDWDETRAGGRATFGKRFDLTHSGSITLRGEDVRVHEIEDPIFRAPEILDFEGHTTLTSGLLQFRRDTTNRGPLLYRGTVATVGWESYGIFAGPTFQKFTGSFDWYIPIYEDLLDRRTVLSVRGDTGFIWGDQAPFFEKFYAGGIGTIRGFDFRGISPRSGPDEDRVGGDFSLTGSAELSFPLAGDNLRGVVFADAGTVEEDVEIRTIRSSIGFGFRLILPIFGQAPLALDFALPLTKDDQDDTQWFSFSFGIMN